MEYNMDNIQQFYDEMDNSLNPKIRKLMVYAGYYEDCERQQKEKEIANLFNSKYNIVHLISDDIAVVEEREKGETSGFFYAVNKKRGYEMFETFDEALIAAIAHKHNNNGATPYAIKLIVK